MSKLWDPVEKLTTNINKVDRKKMADKQNSEPLFMPLNHETQCFQVRRVQVIFKAVLHKSTLTQFNGDISSRSVFNLSALLCTHVTLTALLHVYFNLSALCTVLENILFSKCCFVVYGVIKRKGCMPIVQIDLCV